MWTSSFSIFGGRSEGPQNSHNSKQQLLWYVESNHGHSALSTLPPPQFCLKFCAQVGICHRQWHWKYPWHHQPIQFGQTAPTGWKSLLRWDERMALCHWHCSHLHYQPSRKKKLEHIHPKLLIILTLSHPRCLCFCHRCQCCWDPIYCKVCSGILTAPRPTVHFTRASFQH